MIRDFSWDDIKFFAALAEGGSLTKAASTLNVSEGTVSRRIAALEHKLGARLFDRLSTGHRLTELGDNVFEIAERMSSDVDAFCRTVEGEDKKLDGSLVVTVTSTLATSWMLPWFRDFTREFPQIALEIRETDVVENLHQRAADVAIRVTNAPAPGLVGRRVVRIAYATYATAEVAQAKSKRWIGWVNRAGEDRWKEGPFSDCPVQHRVSSAWSAFEATRAGLGIARLECYLADPDSTLVQIDGPYFERSIWLLTHEGLRNTARVRAFRDYMHERMVADKDRIEADATDFRLPVTD